MELLEQPTPYPEVNAVIHELLSGAQTILGNKLTGMYLHGSLASGDFNSETSDIDFVVVTSQKLDDEMISALKNLHNRLYNSDSKWAKKLEGTYIPQKEFRRYNPNDGPYPCTNEGKFYMAGHESHWVLARYFLLENGVVVLGPAPKDLIDPVSVADIQKAVLGFLNEWWLPMMDNPIRLQSTEYQAYAILSMCRALYTLKNGKITSKPTSAKWAQKTHNQWQKLIEWALSWNQNIQENKFNETKDFIRYTLHTTNN